MTVHTSKGTHWEHVKGGNIYALQLRNFVKAIRGEMSLSTNPEDAINNMRVIDAIYEKAGMKRRGT
jgi:predicted dehydrogenase